MKKRIITRWLAVFVAVLLLPWSMLLSDDMGTVEATETMPTNLEVWTPETAGLVDGDHADFSHTDTALHGQNLNQIGTKFVAMVKFQGANANFWIGNGNGANTGFYLQKSGDNLFFEYFPNGTRVQNSTFTSHVGAGSAYQRETLTAAKAGVDSFFNVANKFALTVEDVTGTAECIENRNIKLGIWFNDQLYNNTYFYMEGSAETLPRNLAFDYGNKNNTTIYLATPEEYKEVTEDPIQPELKKWTPQMAGLEDGYHTSFTRRSSNYANSSESLIGTEFVALVKFQDTGNFWIGSGYGDTPNNTGFYIAPTGSNLFFEYFPNGSRNTNSSMWDAQHSVCREKLTPVQAGVDSFFDEVIEFALTVEEDTDDEDNNASRNIKVGLWFNGRLYNNTYFYLEGSADTLPKGLAFNYGGEIYLGTPGDELVLDTPPLEKFDIWTPQDVGLSYGVNLANLKGGSVGNPAESLDGSVFRAKVTFPEFTDANVAYLNIGGDTGTGNRTYRIGNVSGGKGLDFLPYNGGVADTASGRRLTLMPSNFGMDGETLLGQELELMITTEFKNVRTESGVTRADVEVGIYINGKLYNGGLLTLQNYNVTNYKKKMQVELSSSVSPILNAPEPIVFGDLNYDGVHNSVDLMRAKHVLARGLRYKSFDFYNDGQSGSEDLTLLRRELLGISAEIEYSTTLGFVDFGYTEDFTVVPQEAGVKEGVTQLTTNASIDGTWIEGVYRLSGTETTMDIGNIWGGVQFTRKSDSLQYQFVDRADEGGQGVIQDTTKVVSASMAGVDALFDADVRIACGFTFRNVNAETNTADVTVEVCIGTSYTDRFTVHGVKSDKLTQSIYLYTKAAGDSITLRCGDISYAETLGFADFQQNGSYVTEGYQLAYVENGSNSPSFTAGTGTLDDVLVEGTYQFSGDGTILEIGKVWGGVQILCSETNGTLTFRYADDKVANGGIGTVAIATVSQSEAGCAVIDSEVYIAVGFQFSNVTTSGETTKADVSIEIRVGDNYRYVSKVEQVNIANLNRVLHLYVEQAGGSINLVESLASLSFAAIGGDDVMPIGGFYGPALPQSITGEAGAQYNQYTEETFKQISDMGVNLLVYPNARYNMPDEKKLVETTLDYGAKYGIGVFVNDANFSNPASAETLTLSRVQTVIRNYRYHSAFAGVYVVDEPTSQYWHPELTDRYLNRYAPAYQALQTLGVVGSTNLNPQKKGTDTDYANYASYVDEYCRECDPAYLCFDYYRWDADVQNTPENYFRCMSIIREEAKQNEIPFWSFVAAGGHWNDDRNNMAVSTPYVTEEKFHWSVNTALACGAKGISYFPLIQPSNFAYVNGSIWDFARNGLIGANGQLNVWADYAKDANAQIAACDGVLMNAVNRGIIASGSTVINDTRYFESKKEGTAWRELTNVSGDALVGCFLYQGKTALYVVNYQTEAQNVTLTFDNDYTISQTATGNTGNVTTSGKSITLKMFGGEGRLLIL